MKLAFLYPGQGSQQPGMGADLLADPELERLCRECSEAAGIDLARLLTAADADELRRTENAQPALCFVEVALTRLLRRRGVEPAAAAGHSLGEYAALFAAGALTALEAVRTVAERGRAMAAAVPAGESSLAAVMGLDEAAVSAALEPLSDVWPANFNTPTQTVIGGRVAALAAAAEPLRQRGAKRVIPLNVSGAFHTPLMRPAAERLAGALAGVEWREPGFPVPANVSGRPAPTLADSLERQLYSPVRWSGCVGHLLETGCDTFLEVGPGRVLAGMMRELAPAATTQSVGTPGAVAEVRLEERG